MIGRERWGEEDEKREIGRGVGWGEGDGESEGG